MFLQAEVVLFINNTDNPELKLGAPTLFLESRDKLDLFEEPTRFLGEFYVRSGSTSSPHTWAKAAYGLKSWFQFLQAIDRDWPTASEQDRVDFRDVYLGSISPKTGRAYGAAGVRDAMVVIRSFYQHCADRGTYHGDISGSRSAEEYKVPIDRDALAHTRSAGVIKGKDRALPKVRPGVKIHPLTPRDLKNLLYHVGPQAGTRDGDQRVARDRLICDLGWAVGLRLNEINNLTTLQFMTLSPDSCAPFVGMALTILHGKGNKTRQVMIPAWLVMDVHAYMEGERVASLRACKTKTKNAPTRLLLGHEHSSSAGRPITNAALQKMFREACLTLGLVEIVEKTDPETGEKFMYKTPRHSIHDLRHTYAVLTYHAERANGNAEPWKKIQAQLGHRNLQTTIDTYLSHVEIFTDQPGLLDVRRMLGL
ncbi:site-specific integrase [Janthinobacterium sp. YR213]|uniref:tyrosine-type recombinase/integrase n=1 Tax=Janthinobacterium sp. YR213 TaxID=1881027 RepID=UPI00088F6755|nr:site-specific integrase [Janthinobacterium sp. YR213]SDG90769.1 integrase/recombinase XerC [Janthinobacterium sp. YR213]